MTEPEDLPLIEKVLPAVHRCAGVRFRKKLFHFIAKPFFLEVGRLDMNYGSWVGKKGDRPMLPDAKANKSPDGVLTISARWLKRLHLDRDRHVDEETAAQNAQFARDSGGESFDDYIRRKLADPRE